MGVGGKGVRTTNQEGKARQRPRSVGEKRARIQTKKGPASGVPLRVLDHSLSCFDAGNITCAKKGVFRRESVWGTHAVSMSYDHNHRTGGLGT